MTSETVTNLSSIVDNIFDKATNVTEEFIGDTLSDFVITHVNTTSRLAKTLTNVTEKGVINLVKGTDDVGICYVIISNVTSGNVTTTVTSYNPAACGLYGSNPALKPLLILILVCFMFWAIFGNSCLVGVIATDKNMQEPGNIFLCALAFTDIVQSLLYTPFVINSLAHDESLGDHWCRIQAFVISLMTILSISLQASLWICRYIHIAHPMEFQSMLTHGRLATAMILCFVVALTPPTVGLARTGTVVTNSETLILFGIAEPASLLQPCALGGPEAAVTAFLCWLGVIISCCFAGLIYKEARKSQKKHNIKRAWLAQADKLENKLKAAKTLGIVVGVQWVTWIPGIILGSLYHFVHITVATFALYGDIVYIIFQTSTFSDSIVYAFRNRIYRKALAQLFRRIRNVINDF